MMKLETPIGEFTTDSYKIPAEDTCNPEKRPFYAGKRQRHERRTEKRVIFIYKILKEVLTHDETRNANWRIYY